MHSASCDTKNERIALRESAQKNNEFVIVLNKKQFDAKLMLVCHFKLKMQFSRQEGSYPQPENP